MRQLENVKASLMIWLKEWLMKNDRFENEIKSTVNEAHRFLEKTALEKAHGDIVVTITMYRGQPVKLTTSFCEHLTKRRATGLVVEK